MSKVKFGDIVKDVKFNVDRDNNPYEFYVAGDHMDSEDLNIRRRGRFATDDVGPAFTRIFKKGQVLYGSRRTYLKKVAVADFDGICANTTFVFESKDPAAFEQRLLPFLMLSEGFTNWSIAHSKGSTNPYVLFSDLASYEFYLPSLAEQKVLAEKLWAAYEVKQSYLKMIAATEEMVKSQFIEMFGDPQTNSQGRKSVRFDEVLTLQRGHDLPEKERKNDGVIPIYGSNGFVGYHTESKAKDGIVTGRSGTIGKVYCIKGDYWPLNTSLYSIDNHGNNLTYLKFMVEAFDVSRFSNGTGVPTLNRNDIHKEMIPLVDVSEQEAFEVIAQQADKSISELRKSIDAIGKVIKSLINENL